MEKADDSMDISLLNLKGEDCDLLQESKKYIEFFKGIHRELESNYNEIVKNISEKSKCQNELDHLKIVIAPYSERIAKIENRIKEYEKELDGKIKTLKIHLVKCKSAAVSSGEKSLNGNNSQALDEKFAEKSVISRLKNEIEDLKKNLLNQNKELKEIRELLEVMAGEIANLKDKIYISTDLIERLKVYNSSGNKTVQEDHEKDKEQMKQSANTKDQEKDLIV